MKNGHLLKKQKELIVIIVTVAKIIFAKDWKSDKPINLEDWYKEIWSLAINDRLTSEMKIGWGVTKFNDFKDVWNLYLKYVFLKEKGYRPSEEFMYLWKGMG